MRKSGTLPQPKALARQNLAINNHDAEAMQISLEKYHAIKR
jgi:hypothetical protein